MSGQPYDVLLLRLADLEEALRQAFTAAGLSGQEARVVTAALVDAELCEVPTHGVLRVPGYLNGLRSGRYNAHAEVRQVYRGEAAVLLDADNALGYLPTTLAVDHAVEIAARLGVGVAGVRNSNEFGRTAFYSEAAARQGFVAIVCGNTLPLIGAPGSTAPTHGNNPLSFSAPGESAPLFDASWTPRSGGEVLRRRILGLPLDPAWGYVDAEGQPTTDPARAAGGLPPAAGGAKGFGISVLVDLLAGAITGATSGPQVPRDNSQVGAFVIALAPGIFGQAAALGPAMDASAAAVRAAGARWPGDRSREARARNSAAGYVRVPAPIFDLAHTAILAASEPAAAALGSAIEGREPGEA